jgi:aminoglycoside phosphotransferase (APT) family kinase protein
MGAVASIAITEDLVRALVREQFSEWAELPVSQVEPQGWDNRTFRLGDELAVRLPSAEAYVAAVEKEDRWLPVLAPRLPLSVPLVVAAGRPGCGYPFSWSVRRWLSGDAIRVGAPIDRTALARDLGSFLTALQAVPAGHGPAGGRHSHFRGCHPSMYSEQVQVALDRLGNDVDVAACQAIWVEALSSVWPSPPIWFHGDIAVDNLLASDGKLSAVIDFGSCGVGDPACDLVIAWTYFARSERAIFHKAVGLDDDTWRRARGWALWKALATMAGLSSPDLGDVQKRALVQVLADPVGD